MPSASHAAKPSLLMRQPLVRSAALASCVAVLGASAAGCETTQEKADKQQARSAHILKARAERQKTKKAHSKSKKNHQKAKSK